MNTKKKKINLSNTLMRKLKERIKTELETIYLTTNDKRFLNLNDAIEHELVEEKKRAIVKKKRKMIMKIYELLSRVLSKNEWGIFFKGEPMESFPTQDGIKMYKVNEIAPDRLFDALKNESRQMEKEWQDNSEQQTEGESSNG